MKREAGYAKSFDGTKIYYESIGSGPTLTCCNGIGVSTFFWKYIEEHFSKDYRIITWDYRGHNKSQYPDDLSKLTMDTNVADLRAVLDHLKIKSTMLAGHSMGVQVILEFALQYPERTDALIPMFGTYGEPIKTVFNTNVIDKLFPTIQRVGSSRRLQPLLGKATNFKYSYEIAKLSTIINPMYCGREDMLDYFEHLGRMDKAVFLNMAAHMNDHTTLPYLQDIKAPTLIFAAERDYLTPLYLSKRMASLIPSAEITIIKKGSHAAIVEFPEYINLRIEKFLRERMRVAA